MDNITSFILNNIEKRTHKGLYFMEDTGDEIFVSYPQLYALSMKALRFLKNQGINQGKTLIFQMMEDVDFVNFFWACQFGGIIPIPLAAQNNDGANRKVYNICKQIHHPVILLNEKRLQELQEYFRQQSDAVPFSYCLTDDYKKQRDTLEPAQPAELMESDIAMIQYSSGSTGNPKGVILSHKNITSNVKAMTDRFLMTPDDSGITWLPYTHDMGIIGAHILPVYIGMDVYKIPTELFIRRPSLWFDIASMKKCTMLCSPNFGFRYLMKFTGKRKYPWDLSNIRIICNGAEPISVNLCREFQTAMRQYGLRDNCMFPVYGMAEACLGITFPNVGEALREVYLDRNSLKTGEKVVACSKEDNHAAAFAEVGYPLDCCEVRICDDHHKELPERTIGSIYIRGENVTQGYFNQEAQSRDLFLPGGWLDTGDLGLVRDGRLVITGRKKDILFINGQNFYPNDLEDIVKDFFKERIFEVAVCGKYSPQLERDQVIVFVLYKRNLEKFIPLFTAIGKYMLLKTGVQLDYIIPVKRIPKTTSGKVQHYLLLEAFSRGDYDKTIQTLKQLYNDYREQNLIIHQNLTMTDTQEVLLRLFKEASGIRNIGIDDNYFDFGANSLILTRITKRLDELYPGQITAVDLFTYQNIFELAEYIDGVNPSRERGKADESAAGRKKEDSISRNVPVDDAIAIIGMACKMPMADSPGEYWQIVNNGINCTRKFPSERAKEIESFLVNRNCKNIRYRQGAYLDHIHSFDCHFFKISPAEAALMNPSQRLLLEVAFHAMEEAGYGRRVPEGTDTGVFIGAINDADVFKYRDMIADAHPEKIPMAAIGNLSSITANRISHFLNLKGPSMMLDTACSSSLTALHIACRSLRNQECGMALAGSIRMNLFPLDDANFKIGIESSDDRTRAFDTNSDGSGIGEGVVAFLLKPLGDAIRDRDHIHAVIRGSAVNQDGSSLSITSPNASSQTKVIRNAWQDAKVSPDSITYIEAHGTGTKLGDSIEARALIDAFGQKDPVCHQCAVSSIKSNIGHLYECAGAAGVLKAVMAMKNQTIPPGIEMESPNESLGFHKSPCYVNTRARAWSAPGNVRRCGVSSFGIGGTNCHMVLEEAPPNDNAEKNRRDQKRKIAYILPISAHTLQSLKRLIAEYERFLKQESLSDVDLPDICYTASVGRAHYRYRVAILAENINALRKAVREMVDRGKPFSHKGFGIYYAGGKKPDFLPEPQDLTVEDYFHLPPEEWIGVNQRICQGYVEQGNVQWEKLYQGTGRRIPLPLYPFERTRCWYLQNNQADSKEYANESHPIFYRFDWIESPMLPPVAEVTSTDGTMVLGEEGSLKHKLYQKMKDGDGHVVMTDGYNMDGEKGQEAMERVCKGIRDRQIARIVFVMEGARLRDLKTMDEFEIDLRKNLYSLFLWVKKLHFLADRPMELILVTKYAEKVTGREAYFVPQSAAAIGLFKVLRKECGKIRTKCIDMDAVTPIENLCREIGCNSDGIVSYRDGIRYQQELDRADVKTRDDSGVLLPPEGTLVISGGLGAIGVETAKKFAPEGKQASLVLLNRTPVPKEEQWEEILRGNGDAKQIERLKALMSLKACYKNVDTYCVDVCDEQAVQGVFGKIREKYGKVHGIVHSAGVPGSGLIAEKGLEEFIQTIRVKMQGTIILDRATRPDHPTFFILYSSALTLDGEIGQSDYVAANMFLDAYTAWRNKEIGDCKTVNWVAFAQKGMAADMGYRKDGFFHALQMEEAMDALEKFCQSPEEKLIIGKINPQELLKRVQQQKSHHIAQRLIDSCGGESLKSPGVVGREVVLTGREDGYYSPEEKKLGDLLGNLLGIYQINVRDVFYELGADSILLKQFYEQINLLYPDKLNVSDLFSNPTIEALSAYLAKEGNKKGQPSIAESNHIDKLFDDLESGKLSLDEAASSFEKMDEQE